MKRFLSIFLCSIMILSCFVINVSAETTKITRQEAINWLRSIEGTSIGTPYGYYGECASLGYRYYEKLLGRGIFIDAGGGRTGHGKDYDDNNHSTNLGWQKGTISASTVLQEGDVIVANYEPYGHVAIFVSGSPSNATLAHQANTEKFNGKVKINSGNNIVGRTYVRPNWKNNTGGSSATSSNNSGSSTSKPAGISDTSKTLRWKELNSKYDVTTKELQQCLNYILGSGLKVDGVYGIGTHDAVKIFQGKYGLKVDGDAGPMTLRKVNEVLGKASEAHTTHTYTVFKYYGANHPHYAYYKCSGCDDIKAKNEFGSLNSCSQCTTPGKPVLLNMHKEYTEGDKIELSWKATANTTHYNIYVRKKDTQTGEYKQYKQVDYAESGMTLELPIGEYYVMLESKNSNAWKPDGSDWQWTHGDYNYFTVTAKHTHEYSTKYDVEHPHDEYKECSCGDIEYTGDTRKVKNCEECYPHEHDYEIKYESKHPHKQYRLCECGEEEYTGEMRTVKSCTTCYPTETKTLKLQIGIPNMYVDGVSQEIDPGRDTVPVIRNDRTLLPIRMVVETFGAYVVWDETENKVTIYADDITMEFWINSKKAVVDGTTHTMDVAPVIINERTFMPLRFIVEKMGLEVGWNAGNQTVTVEGEIRK